jgi:branched-chain amino acid transport system ATP-binding protein
MLSLCRAILSKPDILMLDEPSLGLAPRIVHQIFQIVQKLNSQGMTILLVEQNARMALKVSHRAYVLETGNIVLTGEGKSLLENEQIQRSYLG